MSEEARLANIQRVQQEHPYGCVIASLAMLAGKTYAEVLAEYPWVTERDGCDIDTVSFDFLWRHGFAWQQVYPSRPEINRDPSADMGERRALYGRKPWPPAPWAPAHLCQVKTSIMTHAVVMLADGSVLDPADPAPKRLSDYAGVHNVRGIFDVASLATQAAELQACREALEPFAAIADLYATQVPDDRKPRLSDLAPRLKDYRRARAAYSPAQVGEK